MVALVMVDGSTGMVAGVVTIIIIGTGMIVVVLIIGTGNNKGRITMASWALAKMQARTKSKRPFVD